jgi:dihydroxyacetone kinase
LIDGESSSTSLTKLMRLEACGGTLGAIISIFLAGITNALLSSSESKATPEFMGKMALAGLETLKQRTAARVGHRTVMDALIPFAEVLAETGDVKKAAEACRKGGESTVELIAKLGRATYVGEREDGGALPPDPGAMAFVVVAEGLAKVLG